MIIRELLKPSPKSTPPPVAESIDEAASQQFNKLAKLQVAEEAVMVDDLNRLAQQDRLDVAAMKAKRGYPVAGKDDEMILVCDDYHHNDPQPTRIWPVVAALLAGTGLGVGGILGGMAIAKSKPADPPVVENKTIENTIGFGLDAIQSPRK